ncbi:MAG TPA: RebB family R body protein, partial [Bacteroidia bacterium]|nr:RebB family R body protein [Bacteroidia bacterium]
TNPLADLIVDARACTATLSETIAQQNTVMLQFCGGLIEQTLKAMSGLNNLVSATHTEEIKAKLQKQAVELTQQPDSASTMAINAPEGDNPEFQLAQAFVQSINQTMQNMVTAQQQMNITVQAATTQTIATILSVGTVAIEKR